ncbi:hypothetical protein [Paracoccus actinidiae]|jgi:hypothetical protein|uniref:hypothetical protein n=1 Tax=Paracoccus actinidiae TaxID=3064531 RepID=UPI0027D2CF03|nr:hypothetical protein [Paracoccus sp. M09]
MLVGAAGSDVGHGGADPARRGPTDWRNPHQPRRLHGLFKLKGHSFAVIPKGGDRTKITVQWQIMMPFLILLALTAVALILSIFFDGFSHQDAGDGKWVVLFWTIYNLHVPAMAFPACIEFPRHERHIAGEPDCGILATDGDIRRSWISWRTIDRARLRKESQNRNCAEAPPASTDIFDHVASERVDGETGEKPVRTEVVAQAQAEKAHQQPLLHGKRGLVRVLASARAESRCRPTHKSLGPAGTTGG